MIVSQRLKDFFQNCVTERIDSGIDNTLNLDTIAEHRNKGLQVDVLNAGDLGIFSLPKPVIERFGRKN